MIVEGYSLDAYCDIQVSYRDCQHMTTFAGRNQRDAHREAKRAGWILRPKSNYAACPVCLKLKALSSQGKGEGK